MSGELSGADLARTALAAAKAAARKNGTGPGAPAAPKKRLGAVRRGSGRDPVGLGAAFAALVTERGWDLDTKAGSITDRWPEIAPELADTVHTEHYDSEKQRLQLRPANRTVATHLRYGLPQLIARINTHLGRDVVRSIELLPVGPARNLAAAAPTETRNRTAGQPGPMHGPAPAPPNEELQKARAQAKAARAARQAAEEARRAELLAPYAHHCTIAREPETAFLEGVRAREEADIKEQPVATAHDRALAEARRQRHAGADTIPPRTLGAA